MGEVRDASVKQVVQPEAEQEIQNLLILAFWELLGWVNAQRHLCNSWGDCIFQGSIKELCLLYSNFKILKVLF